MFFSGQQRKQLQEALIDAFPTTASLEQMLSFGLDKNLRAIAGEGSLQDIVFKLIQAADSQGWVKDLILAARNSNPGNLRLKTIAQALLPNQAPETHNVASLNIPPELSNQTQQQKILKSKVKSQKIYLFNFCLVVTIDLSIILINCLHSSKILSIFGSDIISDLINSFSQYLVSLASFKAIDCLLIKSLSLSAERDSSIFAPIDVPALNN